MLILASGVAVAIKAEGLVNGVAEILNAVRLCRTLLMLEMAAVGLKVVENDIDASARCSVLVKGRFSLVQRTWMSCEQQSRTTYAATSRNNVKVENRTHIRIDGGNIVSTLRYQAESTRDRLLK